ncbi:gamma-glutamylcyclotransferase [Candidatus Marsarchaeota archaeon]|nr:gamma-glutamylcyclotransferase [Candidatus Marsarchaeota archaeon]MCL5115462.1 gamma-glutamylcyclotransferase [Candidatus Marsarchaeota archaeon]
MAGTEQDETVQFFAYGPSADPEVVAAITGREPLAARPAVIEGYKLGVQNIDDIPDIKVPGLPTTARKIMRESWKDDVPNFEMYVLREGMGRVRGVVYTIRKADMPAMEDWELVPFKWYSIVKGRVTFDDGSKSEVQTIAVKDQNVQREVDGMYYDLFLGRGEAFKEIFLSHVRANRRQYLERERSGVGTAGTTPITSEDISKSDTDRSKNRLV